VTSTTPCGRSVVWKNRVSRRHFTKNLIRIRTPSTTPARISDPEGITKYVDRPPNNWFRVYLVKRYFGTSIQFSIDYFPKHDLQNSRLLGINYRTSASTHPLSTLLMVHFFTWRCNSSTGLAVTRSRQLSQSSSRSFVKTGLTVTSLRKELLMIIPAARLIDHTTQKCVIFNLEKDLELRETESNEQRGTEVTCLQMYSPSISSGST
jgi:hypothetical protein